MWAVVQVLLAVNGEAVKSSKDASSLLRATQGKLDLLFREPTEAEAAAVAAAGTARGSGAIPEGEEGEEDEGAAGRDEA